MPNTENRKNSNKKPTLQEHSQTVIIPQLTPEMLEQARRAAEQGKTAEQIEQEALAAAQAEQKAVESKQEAPTAEKPKTVQPANKPKTRKEAEEELAQNIHDDHLWLNNPVMVRGLGLAPIVAAAVSGQNAWMLCAATILLVTATRMLAVAICHLTGNRFRGVVYSYAAAIVYVPAYIILYNLFGADLSLLGIYLPMLVVEPAVIKRMESNDLETVGEACSSICCSRCCSAFRCCWWGLCVNCWRKAPCSATWYFPWRRCRWPTSRAPGLSSLA